MLRSKCFITSVLKSCLEVNRRELHISVTCQLKERRINRGEPENHNKFGPLTDLPDYTYLDGRPTPIGSHQKARLMQSRKHATRIVELISQVDFAKSEFQRKQIEKEEKERRIIANRLKEKGDKIE